MKNVGELDIAALQPLIRMALDEDIGSGDVTSKSVIPAGARAQGRLVAKEDGVIAGLKLVPAVYALIDSGVIVRPLSDDGDRVHRGSILAEVEGPAIPILTGERIALNFLQRLSGVATLTSRYVEAVRGTRARILDTRKTTPGMRRAEKYAVRMGGGTNHRHGLYDLVLIKDNHLELAGGEAIGEAVSRARQNAPTGLRVEVETENLRQVEEALDAKADIIMLDNMAIEMMTEAVRLIRRAEHAVEIEASGGITLDSVRSIAQTGVDFISVGGLTHSAPALDISLDVHSTRFNC